jgi:pantoate--beta-alanine ligase
MIVCQSIKQLRQQIGGWRKNNQSIAFVPTMGNLHEGHLSLVDIAQQKAPRVVVSIFVNPLQFSPDEDYASYPRTLEDDLKKLEIMGVDLVFTPDTQMIYPDGERQSTFVEVPLLSTMLEGEFRPGFFKGVSTIVLKLFNMVQADYAVFGEKDFQQLLVIKQMVNDLNLPIEIIAGAIKREANGLTMSSRNNYLTSSDREKSCFLSKTLLQCRQQIEQGISIKQAEQNAVNTLENHGFTVDYVALREAAGLGKVCQNEITGNKELIVLAAAKIGNTRLIDNMKFVLE